MDQFVFCAHPRSGMCFDGGHTVHAVISINEGHRVALTYVINSHFVLDYDIHGCKRKDHCDSKTMIRVLNRIIRDFHPNVYKDIISNGIHQLIFTLSTKVDFNPKHYPLVVMFLAFQGIGHQKFGRIRYPRVGKFHTIEFSLMHASKRTTFIVDNGQSTEVSYSESGQQYDVFSDMSSWLFNRLIAIYPLKT
jgi:hypothetical protein